MHPNGTPIAPSLEGVVRRVLIVDDSAVQLRILRSILERWDFEIRDCTSGEDALAACEDWPPDLVISDWMMPGMTGLEFCRTFRALSQGSYGYFILLTSKSEKGEVAQGLDAGADDFLTKPVNAHELRARITAGARILSMQRELEVKNQQVSEALSELQEIHEEIDRDLRQARTIQQALIPERVRVYGRSRVSLFLQPCGHVGGDLVGMFSPESEKLGLYSIDVSGHGITSAMVTARVAGYFSGRFLDQNIALSRMEEQVFSLRDPSETAGLLNERLAADPGVEEYLTMAYATVDLAWGRARVVQAGHSPPIVLRADGSVELPGAGGLPIGLVEEVLHETLELQLGAGDRMLLYSDGLTEAVMKDGTMLGEEGLVAMIQEGLAQQSEGPELLQDLFWRLTEQMQNGANLSDDVSMAMLEYNILPEQAVA